jgi:conjugal transfer pilus assembly protein TraA
VNKYKEAPSILNEIEDTLEKLVVDCNTLRQRYQKWLNRSVFLGVSLIISVVVILGMNDLTEINDVSFNLPKTVLAEINAGGIEVLVESEEIISTSKNGKNAEFGKSLDLIVGWADGPLVKFLSLTFLVVGMVMGIMRQSIMAFVPAVGAALALYMGPKIIEGIVVPLPGGVTTSTVITSKKLSVSEMYGNIIVNGETFSPWPTNDIKKSKSVMSLLEKNEQWDLIQHYISETTKSMDKSIALTQVAVMSSNDDLARELLMGADINGLNWANGEVALSYETHLWNEARSEQAVSVKLNNDAIISYANWLGLGTIIFAFGTFMTGTGGWVQRKNWKKATVGIEQLKSSNNFFESPIDNDLLNSKSNEKAHSFAKA